MYLPPLAKRRPPSSGVDEGRFPAGTVLGGRYKILGLIGRGGIGEADRASTEFLLNQAVALKFIIEYELDEATLNRFPQRSGRAVRQVSHPNVCRVYDIGFVEGMHFPRQPLTAETLPRLPSSFSRRRSDRVRTKDFCAGLAAATGRAQQSGWNMMIDGRGQVRITDFGLAAFAKEIAIGDLRKRHAGLYVTRGTRAGRQVTTRSDIYAPGLVFVLHEMFTDPK